jgi:hypothetical protein
VLHALRCGDQPCVQFFWRGMFLDHFGAFLDQPFHALALLSLRTLFQRFEDLLQALHMPFRLLQVFFKSCAQILGGRCLGHFRQGFHHLVFRVVEVLSMEISP